MNYTVIGGGCLYWAAVLKGEDLLKDATEAYRTGPLSFSVAFTEEAYTPFIQ